MLDTGQRRLNESDVVIMDVLSEQSTLIIFSYMKG